MTLLSVFRENPNVSTMEEEFDPRIRRIICVLTEKLASKSCPEDCTWGSHRDPIVVRKFTHWCAALLGLSAFVEDPKEILSDALNKIGYFFEPDIGTAYIFLLSSLASTLLGCLCDSPSTLCFFIQARHHIMFAYLKDPSGDIGNILACYALIVKAQDAYLKIKYPAALIGLVLRVADTTSSNVEQDRPGTPLVDIKYLSECLRKFSLQESENQSVLPVPELIHHYPMEEELDEEGDSDDSDNSMAEPMEENSDKADPFTKDGYGSEAVTYSKDGSEEAEIYNKDGSEVAETYPKGGSLVAETYSKGGSKEAESYSKDGSEEAEIYNKDGSEVAETYSKGGSKEAEAYSKDGSEEAEIFNKDGSEVEETFSNGGSEEAETSGYSSSEDEEPYIKALSDNDKILGRQTGCFVSALIGQEMGFMRDLECLDPDRKFDMETLYEEVLKFAKARSSSASSNEEQNILDEAIMELKDSIMSVIFEYFQRSAKDDSTANGLTADNLTLGGLASLGISLGKSGHDATAYLEDAVGKLEEALEMDANKAETLCYVSCAYARLFLLTKSDIYFPKAEKCIAEAIEKDPDESLFKECQELLSSLKHKDRELRMEKRKHGDAFGEQVDSGADLLDRTLDFHMRTSP